MLFIRPCCLQSPRALYHLTPERSGVYLYRPDFSHILKVGVLHILFQHIIFSPKQNRGIGEKTGKLPIFARPLTSSISPISRFFAKMPLSLYIKGCFVAIFTKSAAINRRPFSPIRIKTVSGFFPFCPERGAVEVPRKTSFRGWAGLKQDKKEFLQ